MFKKESILSIAIMLLFVFFIGYGIEVFSSSPEREDYCPDPDIPSQECIAQGGTWNGNSNWCQPPKSCYSEYQDARTFHDLIVFVVAIVLGLAAVIIGVLLTHKAVASGIVGGGVLLILYGTIRYWQHANNILKFILLGVALAVVITVGYRKLEQKSS